jgi:hypothetical protein
MKTFTGQRHLIETGPLWSHRWGGSVTLLNNHRHNAAKHTLKTQTYQNKTKRLLVAHGDYPNTGNCWTKISEIFRGIFITFICGISKFLFISWFLAEPWLWKIHRGIMHKAMPITVWSSRILTSSRFTEFRNYSKHHHQATPRMWITKMNGVIYPLCTPLGYSQ